MKSIRLLFLLVIFIFNYVSSCTFSNDEKRFRCKSPFGISSIGTKDWKNILLYSNEEKLNLKKDTFVRTPNLEVLSLASIASLEQGTFNGLIKLDRFIIYESDMDEIPLGVLDDLPIRSLFIYNNGLSRLSPGFFKNLPDVRRVSIDINPLKEIKAGIFSDTLIYQLFLVNNHLSSIEHLAFTNMTSMILLSLTNNTLTTFNAKLSMGEINVLEELMLDINKLTKISKNMFETLRRLEKLSLDFNYIETIEDGAFHHMPKLSEVELSNNKLKEIQLNVFPQSGMPDLKYIFLHNNHLTFINNALFIRTPKLHFLSIGGNPFQCPCLDETKDWLDLRNITRLCDDVYFTGERPVCLFTKIEKTICIYEVNLDENLYELYTEALEDYPDLKQKCYVKNRIGNATLIRK